MNITATAKAMVNLERVVAAVKGQEEQESKFAKALATLETLARKEGIPMAIVGGWQRSFMVTSALHRQQRARARRRALA